MSELELWARADISLTDSGTTKIEFGPRQAKLQFLYTTYISCIPKSAIKVAVYAYTVYMVYMVCIQYEKLQLGLPVP